MKKIYITIFIADKKQGVRIKAIKKVKGLGGEVELEIPYTAKKHNTVGIFLEDLIDTFLKQEHIK